MQEEFIKFLRIHGEKRRFITEAGWLYESLYDEKPEDYIRMAFDWSETKRGYDYWNRLDESWQIRLHNVKNNCKCRKRLTK